MAILWQEQLRPGVALREIVRQATAALITMDADRLEELALCCADLNREIQQASESGQAANELADVVEDLNLLGMVLAETRANLAVITRLRVRRSRASGFPPVSGRGAFDGWLWPGRSSEYGDD